MNNPSSNIISLIGGGFKPFTVGHYSLVEEALGMSDEVRLFVSTSNRRRKGELPIQWSGQMDIIWKKYIENILPGEVSTYYVKNPLVAMWDTLDKAEENPKDENIYAIFGRPNDLVKYFPIIKLKKRFPRLMENGQIYFHSPKNLLPISATALRKSIQDNDVIEFSKGLPAGLRASAEEILRILSKKNISENKNTYTKDTINEELISFLSEGFRGFNLGFLKKIKNPIEKYEYAEKYLPKMGQGSSRVVFGIGAGKVLKLAGDFDEFEYYKRDKEKKSVKEIVNKSITWGIAQNKEEINIFTNPSVRSIVTKIIDFSKDYTWIVSEAVREINENEFADYSKISFPFFQDVISSYRGQDFVLGNNRQMGMDDFIDFLIQNSIFNLFRSFDKYGETHSHSSGAEEKEKIKKYLKSVIFSNFMQSVFSLIDAGSLPGDMSTIVHWGKTPDGHVVIMDYGLNDDVLELYFKI